MLAENNISYAVLVLNDYLNKNYISVFDVFNTVDISFRYGSGAWTKEFGGYTSGVNPTINERGELLTATMWGKGWATIKTCCNTSYGIESKNPTLDTPKEILDDLIVNYLNLSFGGANTHWGIGNKVENVHAALSITNLTAPYLDNFTVINRLCDLVNAYAQGLGAPEASIHWRVDPSANLYVKKIDANHSDGNWNKWWRTDQAGSTLTVTEDMILYDFQKHIEEYANKIVLCTAFRKPAYDIWNEDNGPVWGTVDCTATYDNTQKVVGSHSLLVQPNNEPALGLAYYPSNRAAGWDLTKCGSQNTIPTINFYVRANDTNCFGFPIYLFTDCVAIGGATNDYYWSYLDEYMEPRADKWIHVSLPVGPYYALDPSLQKGDETDEFEWNAVSSGLLNWNNINGIVLIAGGVNTYDKWFDDLHFSGKIIREAYDASEITATQKEHQRTVRNDVALDDTLKAAGDSGTAARLAYAELLRRALSPVVGKIRIPLAEDVLPGHWVHGHACHKSDGSYRVDSDFRVKEVRHQFTVRGASTVLNLTDDVTNSHAFAAPDQMSLLLEYAGALGHAEAKNLKVSGIDFEIPRLTKSY